MQFCRQRPGSLMRRLMVASIIAAAITVIVYTGRAHDEEEESHTGALSSRTRHRPAKNGPVIKDKTKVRLFGEWQRMGQRDDDDVTVETRRKRRRKQVRSVVDGLAANDWRSSDDSKSEKKSRRSSVVLDRRMLLSQEIKMTQSDSEPRRSNTTVHGEAFDAKSIPTAGPVIVGTLRGGPGKCTVYDVRADITRNSDTNFSNSECVRLSVPLIRFVSTSATPVLVCPHPDLVGKHLSKPLRATAGVWKPHVVRVFVAAVENLVSLTVNSSKDGGRSFSSTVGVYDIGANVGQYSLLAAGLLSCRVVAVEPFKPNIYRLHKAVQLNGLAEQVIVVQNAVSDVHDTFELALVDGDPSAVSLTSQDADRYCDEPGCPTHATTIFIDDLLEVTNFDVAVMRIYVEGFEHRAFTHADQLLTEVRVAYIFMEWTRMAKHHHVSTADATEDTDLVRRMVDSLTVKHGYTPFGLDNGLEVLRPQNWHRWPRDIVWVHSTATPPRALVKTMTSHVDSLPGDPVV